MIAAREAVVATASRLLAIRRAGAEQPDAGSALVEFLGATLLLLVPVVYLVIALGSVQAATFAVDTAARESARALTTSEPAELGRARAEAAVALALQDQGLEGVDVPGALTTACSPDCTTAGSTVTVEVAVEVPLPGVPAFVGDHVPLVVPVHATVTAPVESFR